MTPPIQSKADGKKASMEIYQMDIQRALSISLAEIDNLTDGLSLCLDASLQISGMNCGAIFLFDEITGDLNLTVHKGLNDAIVNLLAKFECDSETALLVKKGAPVYTLVEKLPFPITQNQKQGRLRAFAVAPLFFNKRVIGCIAVSSTTFNEISLPSRIGFETISAQAGNVIARLQATKQLQESEAHLRSLMQSAEHFALYRLIVTPSNPHKLEVAFVSPSIREIMGISDPMKFETWFENIHAQDRERVIAANMRAFQTLRFNEIMRIDHPLKKEPCWVQAVSLGLTKKNGELRYVNGIISDITKLKRAEAVLTEKETALQARTTKLEETNTALKVLLQKRDEDKAFMQAQVLANIKKLITPYFKKMQKGQLDKSQKAYLDIIESNLQQIISAKSIGFSAEYYGLTRAELVVADLIQHGKKTKEIAGLLSLSPKTIEVHRNRIRKKLGITNKKVNLQTYLNSMQ
jgi:DNA-binding CsgD family transcriptional regulator/PAS domain-containing protein